VDKSVKSVDNGCIIANGGDNSAMSEPKNSPFKNSLLYLALKKVLDEIRSDDNTYYAGEHFHNDPRKNQGERLLHYIESGCVGKAIDEFKDANPHLRSPTKSPESEEGEAIAA